ncbi:ASCH domain-containing protein [Saccharopolyspora phatthalungensis]|uniref:Cytidine deaminase n=1 Tax=Saccharopolyspora phatthalungensis TaxID=664693 RepID=A0A840QEK0_9PSEU|nr:ASCH domain-containing protein [Saccharopolyspora phatthalungensis]MBB5158280.1 cytidine deaminase [Saccharopolyspora phatthalungensis]
MITDFETNLVQAAVDLIDRCQGNDNHSVAAAALDSAGRIHTGLNVYHFTRGPCAELVVLGQAAASSDQLPLTTIVAALDGGRGVIPPCGRCRQVLFDYFPGIRVIVNSRNGLTSVPIIDLLPYVFDERSLEPGAGVQKVYFHPAYLAAVRAGTKTSTIRFQDPVRLGPAELVFETDDGDVTVRAEVTILEEKAIRDLSDTDAVRDGFADRHELLATLEQHYPGIASDANVTLVHFVHPDSSADFSEGTPTCSAT